jgi:3-oxoacyl-[acyl-carrier-protein] synthase-3
VSYAMLEVVDTSQPGVAAGQAQEKPTETAVLLRQLNEVWHNYRSTVMRSQIAKKIVEGSFKTSDYLRWMENWIPQVREGSLWMREGIANAPAELRDLTDLIGEHANEEQFDFRVLYEDYRRAGGTLELDQLKRNPGGEALNAFMYATAKGSCPQSLLGGIFIIEGTGQKIIPSLLPKLKENLGLHMNVFKFLEYHGENDQRHLERWLNGIEICLAVDPNSAQKILQTAKTVATLYALQWEMIEP